MTEGVVERGLHCVMRGGVKFRVTPLLPDPCLDRWMEGGRADRVSGAECGDFP